MPPFKAWLKVLLAPAPDPRQSPVFAFQRQQDLLSRVQAALAGIAGAKARLEAKAAEVRAKMPELEEQARQALREQREDRALMALRRRRVAMAELEALGDQLREVEEEEHR